jgi:elongator complex protein 6
LISGTGLFIRPASTEKDELLQAPLNSLDSPQEHLDRIFEALNSRLEKYQDQSSRPGLILEGIDFVLASLDISKCDYAKLVQILLRHIHKLRLLTSSLLLCLSADQSLLVVPEYGSSDSNRYLLNITPSTAADPLEELQTRLLTSSLHQADCVFAIRSLDTGFARDVSGIITCRRKDGKALDSDVVDSEYLFQKASNGSVKVWKRGVASAER